MAAWYFCGLGLLRTSSAPPKAHNSVAASSRLTAFALASPGHDRIKTTRPKAMTNSKRTLIILTALNEMRAGIVTAPAWAWLWHYAAGVPLH
jgi:hypothetical protein